MAYGWKYTNHNLTVIFAEWHLHHSLINTYTVYTVTSQYARNTHDGRQIRSFRGISLREFRGHTVDVHFNSGVFAKAIFDPPYCAVAWLWSKNVWRSLDGKQEEAKRVLNGSFLHFFGRVASRVASRVGGWSKFSANIYIYSYIITCIIIIFQSSKCRLKERNRPFFLIQQVSKGSFAPREKMVVESDDLLWLCEWWGL